MEFLYLANLIVASLFPFLPFWWSKRFLRLPLLNPVTIMAIFMIPISLFRLFVGPYFSDGGFSDKGYQFAVLMTNTQHLISLGMLVFYFRWSITSALLRKLPRGISLTPTLMKSVALVFFVIYALAFLYLAQKTGGIVDWLYDPRDSYIQKRNGNGLYFALAINCLSLSYFFIGFSATNKVKFTLVSFIYIAVVYFFGSKGYILTFFAFYLIIIWRIEFKHFGIILGVGIISSLALILFNFFSNRSVVDFASVAEYFDYYINAAHYYNDFLNGTFPLYKGKIFLTSLWEYVPRGLFPDKPYVYGILHIVEYYFPGSAETGNTPAFEGGVFQFADFGFLGIILFSVFDLTVFLKALSLSYLFKKKWFFENNRFTITQVLVSIVAFSPSFGVFMPVGLLFIFLLSVFIMILMTKEARGILRLATYHKMKSG